MQDIKPEDFSGGGEYTILYLLWGRVGGQFTNELFNLVILTLHFEVHPRLAKEWSFKIEELIRMY